MGKLPKTFTATNQVDLTGKTEAQAKKLRNALFQQPDIHPALAKIAGVDAVIIKKPKPQTPWIKWIWGQWLKYAAKPGDAEGLGVEEFKHKFKVREL